MSAIVRARPRRPSAAPPYARRTMSRRAAQVVGRVVGPEVGAVAERRAVLHQPVVQEHLLALGDVAAGVHAPPARVDAPVGHRRLRHVRAVGQQAEDEEPDQDTRTAAWIHVRGHQQFAPTGTRHVALLAFAAEGRCLLDPGGAPAHDYQIGDDFSRRSCCCRKLMSALDRGARRSAPRVPPACGVDPVSRTSDGLRGPVAKGWVSDVLRSRPAYPEQFRRETTELLRQGRTPRELSESLVVVAQQPLQLAPPDQIDRNERDVASPPTSLRSWPGCAVRTAPTTTPSPESASRR